MKLHLSSILLAGILACIAPHSLSAATSMKPATSASETSASETIALENFFASRDVGRISGENITLNSDMSSGSPKMWSWRSTDAVQKCSLSGKGSMPAGNLDILAESEASTFTIEKGIQFLKTNVRVAGKMNLIFKGEFISNDYVGKNGKYYMAVHEGSSIDFNDATLDPKKCLELLLRGGTIISDKYSIMKNHSVVLQKSSSFKGNLSIDAGARLCYSPDYSLKGLPSKLNVSGSLTIADNASFDFKASVGVDHSKKASKKASNTWELKSGTVIASASSIKANLSKLKVTMTIQEVDRKTGPGKSTSKLLKGMKVVAVKNGDHYDLVLRSVEK